MSKPSKISRNPHSAGIYADMSVDGPAIGTLICIIDRAKNLPNRKTIGKQNPYCAARLGKDAKKTDTDLRGGQTPKWDQELRFTVHESSDYFRLKVSVFNDDKKTDLIGETWIDLKDVIIPGGSQNDQWHLLHFRGKYAGEVRIEMTYYDTRPEDEAVIEKRKEAAERAQTRAVASTGAGTTYLSGARQLKDVSRRPLPAGPTDPTVLRPPEQATFPAPMGAEQPPRPGPIQPSPTGPVYHDLSFPPAVSAGFEHTPMMYSGNAEFSSGLPQRRMNEHFHPFRREYDSLTRNSHSSGLEPQNHQGEESLDNHSRLLHPHAESDDQSPVEFHPTQQRQPSHGEQHGDENIIQQPQDTQSWGYDDSSTMRELVRHQGHAEGYQQILIPRQGQQDYRVAAGESAHYVTGSSDANTITLFQPDSCQDDRHAEYASRQPRVEDDEEELPPPPPPVHRSGLGQHNQRPGQPDSSVYHAYSPDLVPSRTPMDAPLANSLPSPVSNGAFQTSQSRDVTLQSDPLSMPPSLVAGYDPSIAEAESDRAAYETRAIRRNSALPEEILPAKQGHEVSSLETPTHSVHASSQPVSREITGSGKRILPQRKSVSSQSPPVSGRSNSSIPFGPDYYDSLNPNGPRSTENHDLASPAKGGSVRSDPRANAADVIISDDGRLIDPSDHLPAETWAPEPERKPKKPEVIVRFKHSTKFGSQPPKNAMPTKVKLKSQLVETGSYFTDSTAGKCPRSSHMSDSVNSTPPRVLDTYASYGHNRQNSTPTAIDTPRSWNGGSVSPTSRHQSNFYAPTYTGPPIPTKVPIAKPLNYGSPVMNGSPSLDALSMELQSIDIGSVGCTRGRGTRKYIAQASAAASYAT